MPVVTGSSSPGTSTVSSIKVMDLVDYARLFPTLTSPAVGLSGYSDQPALSYANQIMQEVFATSNPWKWNETKVPAFQTQPYQQDYPTNISMNLLGWLQAVVFIDINNPTQPIPTIPGTCVQKLMPTMICDRPSSICWIANAAAQTGVWPGAGAVFTDPLVANGGGPSNNPLTAITDPNGNIQTVTQYGVTGATQPVWPVAGSAVGTTTNDGTVVWTLMDPLGIAIRVNSLATNNSVVWQVRSLYQPKPPRITSLTQTFSPVPDDLEFLLKTGFITYCAQQSSPTEFPIRLANWQAMIKKALGTQDREQTELGFFPASPVQGGYGDAGGTGTYGYPGWPGWS